MRERRSDARSGRLRPLVSLLSRPGFRLAGKEPQLGQDLERRSTASLERIDPREPLDDGL